MWEWAWPELMGTISRWCQSWTRVFLVTSERSARVQDESPLFFVGVDEHPREAEKYHFVNLFQFLRLWLRQVWIFDPL